MDRRLRALPRGSLRGDERRTRDVRRGRHCAAASQRTCHVFRPLSASGAWSYRARCSDGSSVRRSQCRICVSRQESLEESGASLHCAGWYVRDDRDRARFPWSVDHDWVGHRRRLRHVARIARAPPLAAHRGACCFCGRRIAPSRGTDGAARRWRPGSAEQPRTLGLVRHRADVPARATCISDTAEKARTSRHPSQALRSRQVCSRSLC